jgi:hypothetical protein
MRALVFDPEGVLLPDIAQQHIRPMFLRPNDAATFLGRSVPWIWKLIQTGKLDAVRDGPRCTMVTMESIERYIASLPKVIPGNTVPANIASQRRAAAKAGCKVTK